MRGIPQIYSGDEIANAGRPGEQKQVVLSDDYYVFTRKTSRERLMVVFSKGDAAKSVSLELTDTSIANARGLAAENSAAAAVLQGTSVQLQLAPQSVAIYKVE